MSQAGQYADCEICEYVDQVKYLEKETSGLREKLADAYKELSGKTNHASDCATSQAPGETPDRCDCDAK